MLSVGQFQLGSLSMEPVKQLKEALSTMFDHMIQANNELRQQMVVLKADCDRLAADRTDALKVPFAYLSVYVFFSFVQLFIGTACRQY